MKSLPVLKDAFVNTLEIRICMLQLRMERKNKGRREKKGKK